MNIQLMVDSTIKDIEKVINLYHPMKKDLSKTMYYSALPLMFHGLESLMMVTVYNVISYKKNFFLDFKNSMEDDFYEFLKDKTALQKSGNNCYLNLGKITVEPDGHLKLFEDFAKATIKKFLELGYEYNKEKGYIKESKMKVKIKESTLNYIIERCLVLLDEQFKGKKEPGWHMMKPGIDLSKESPQSFAAWVAKEADPLRKLYDANRTKPNEYKEGVLKLAAATLPIGHGVSQEWWDKFKERFNAAPTTDKASIMLYSSFAASTYFQGKK